MRFRFVNFVVMLVLILSPVAIPADEEAPSSSRWGITTKKNLEQPRITEEIEETQSDPEETQAIAPALPNHQGASSPSVNTDGNVKVDPTQQPSPDKQTSTDKSHTKAATGNTSKAIDWSSEGQKKACDGYLKDLRSLFLKTRHYSIQGASCDTAESAAAFLDSMGKCQRNCPEGLLERNGYTERIIRNIRYLEKLGNDRCSGSLTPNPQVTQKP